MTKKKILLIALITLALVPASGQTQTLHHAGIVVQFPDGRVETVCVTFSEDEITGLDLLNRSQLSATYEHGSGLGAAVCKIGETGCNTPDQSCFCQCQGSPCNYWTYWQLKDRQWVYSPLGAGNRWLGNGEVDGWIWGEGKQPPQLVSLEEICEVENAAPEVVATATTTAFPSPLETPTVQSTATHATLPTATSPASPLMRPTAIARPPGLPTSTPVSQVFLPSTSDKPPASEAATPSLPPSPDRHVAFAGTLAALGLIALTIWRRRKGV